MDRYFSPAFRDAHRASMASKDAAVSAVRNQEARGRRALAGEPEPLPEKDRTKALAFGAAMILLLALGNLHLLRRIRVGAKDPHVLRVGLKRYRLDWATGVVADYRQREEVKETVYVRKDARGNEVRNSGFTTHRYEDFVLDGSAGPEEIHVLRVFDGMAGLHSGPGDRARLGRQRADWSLSIPHDTGIPRDRDDAGRGARLARGVSPARLASPQDVHPQRARVADRAAGRGLTQRTRPGTAYGASASAFMFFSAVSNLERRWATSASLAAWSGLSETSYTSV